MGEVTRVLITGASGFVGRATVKAALGAGLQVIAVQRRAGVEQPGVSYVSTDLTVQDAVARLTSALEGCDAAIHLAAAMSGGPRDHQALTVDGTKRLIEAMHAAGVGHLTLASSIAVFDTDHVPIGGDLTEACPLVDPDRPRDSYSDAKMQQEKLARDAGFGSFSILRPGIVYDQDHLWNAHLGVGLGPVLLRFGQNDRVPMCHVGRCAAALVDVTQRRATETLTVLDPVLPTRGAVIAALRRSGWPKAVLPFPWQMLWQVTRLLRPVSGHLPGLLRDSVLRQRGLPMGNRFQSVNAAEAWPDPAPDWGDGA